jgi:hypothetical protein
LASREDLNPHIELYKTGSMFISMLIMDEAIVLRSTSGNTDIVGLYRGKILGLTQRRKFLCFFLKKY